MGKKTAHSSGHSAAIPHHAEPPRHYRPPATAASRPYSAADKAGLAGYALALLLLLTWLGTATEAGDRGYYDMLLDGRLPGAVESNAQWVEHGGSAAHDAHADHGHTDAH